VAIFAPKQSVRTDAIRADRAALEFRSLPPRSHRPRPATHIRCPHGLSADHLGPGGAIFGTGAQNVIIAITIPLIPRCARVVRASALAIREIPYVDVARALGFGHLRIILFHMVPNVMAPFLIMVTAFVGQAILAEASLSYLGLGVQEPVPAWGLMLQGGAEEFATNAPWIAIFPGLAIVLSVLGINLLGDALRDSLDPKLRKS
jgi:peptide/nickel transport system permease protein